MPSVVCGRNRKGSNRKVAASKYKGQGRTISNGEQEENKTKGWLERAEQKIILQHDGVGWLSMESAPNRLKSRQDRGWGIQPKKRRKR